MASKWTMGSTDAHNYIVDPLHAPEPSEETGLNSSFRSTFARPTKSQENLVRQQQQIQEQHKLHVEQQRLRQQKRLSTDPETQKPAEMPEKSSPIAKDPIVTEREIPSSPGGNRRRASSNVGSPSNSPYNNMNGRQMPRRGMSLNHHGPRQPQGRMSPRPKRMSFQPIDTIDSLDFGPGGPYHHEGPFDATLLSRNLFTPTSPVAAVAESNAAALKATPRENVMDAINKHRPLDGVASVPPGVQDQWGRQYSYEERNVMEDENSGGGKYGKYEWIGGRNLDEAQKDTLYSMEPWKIRNDYPSNTVAEKTSLLPSKFGSTRRGRVSIVAPDEDADAIELQDESKGPKKKSVEIQEHELDREESGPSSSGETALARSHSLRNSLKKKFGSLRRKAD